MRQKWLERLVSKKANGFAEAENPLADIMFERARYRRKLKSEERRPFVEDKVNVLEMALKSPESLIAIAEVLEEAIDRNAHQQWLLQIRDINVLWLLKILDLKIWMKGMGGDDCGRKASIQSLLQETESIIYGVGVEEAK